MGTDGMFSRLNETAPEFSIKSTAIKFIDEPHQFFSILSNRIENASRRITIASLYLGNGHLEQQLVSGIQHAREHSNGRLRVQLLLDFTRGSRGSKNSRTMLLPLLERYPDGVRVALYHTPDLRGFLRRIMPDRWNEIIGLAHMKIYIVDDTAIISGANLSNDYFTNRQDRYVIFDDANLTNFLDELVTTVSSFSLQLQPDNSLSLSSDWKIHPYNGSRSEFKQEAKKRIESLLKRWRCIQTASSSERLTNADESINSKVYPLIQMAPFGIVQDSQITESIFKSAPHLSTIYLTSGYFNLTNHYLKLMLNYSSAQYAILTAAPEANGFFKAKGLPGYVPDVYTYIAKKFYEKLLQLQQSSRISLFEYDRRQWTFHAKGMWYYCPNATLPSMTLIGSPNFGHRSVYRDLEIQVAIVTKNQALQQTMHSEQKRLYSIATPVTGSTFALPERYVPIWVRLVSCVFRKFF